MHLEFYDGIDTLPHKIVIYQCGACAEHFAINEDHAWIHCPYCTSERVWPYQMPEGFMGHGFNSKKEEENDCRPDSENSGNGAGER